MREKPLIFLLSISLSWLIYGSIFAANRALSDISHILDRYSNKEDSNNFIWSKNSINPSVRALKNNYRFILFYKSSCIHCRRFAPVVRKYSIASGIAVNAYTFDGVILPTFPQSTSLDRKAMQDYFGNNSDFRVPALFIVHEDNMHLFAVSRGEMTYGELISRMNSFAPKILQTESRRANNSDGARYV